MLNHLKFPQQFMKWVMACLTSVTYIMQMNGHQGGEFIGGRGLKQGDSLSPLLFVLSMEYFSRLMKKASSQPEFTYHPHCKDLKLTHLLFADNVLIFCKAHPPTLQLIMKALEDFHTCVGLQSNHSKSQIVFGGCDTCLQQQCL